MPIEMYTLGLPQERQTLVRVNDERPPRFQLCSVLPFLGIMYSTPCFFRLTQTTTIQCNKSEMSIENILYNFPGRPSGLVLYWHVKSAICCPIMLSA